MTDPKTKQAARSLVRGVARLFVVAVVSFLVWRFVQNLGVHELVERIRTAKGPLVIAAVACIGLRFVLIYIRWSMVLSLVDRNHSNFVGWSALMTGVLLNHVTPTARALGGLVRARGLSKLYDTSFSTIYGTVLVEQITNQVVQTVVTWLVTIPFLWAVGWHRLAVAVAVAPPIVGLGVLLWRRKQGRRKPAWMTFLQKHLRAQQRRFGPLATGGRRVAQVFRLAFGNVQLQMRLAVLGVGVVVCNATALWLVLASLGTDIAYVSAFATVCLGLAVGLITGTPGGVATTEAAMIALLVALGIPQLDAAAGVLLYRGLHYLIVIIVGGCSAIIFEVLVSRVPRSRDQHAAADPLETERLENE